MLAARMSWTIVSFHRAIIVGSDPSMGSVARSVVALVLNGRWNSARRAYRRTSKIHFQLLFHASVTLEDLPLTPCAEIAESFSILEAAAEQFRISEATYFLRKAKMVYIADDSNKKAKQSEIRSYFDTCT